MDAWFKAKAGELAQAAQQIDAAKYVTDLQQSASQLTAELTESFSNVESILNIDHVVAAEGCKEAEFQEGPFGFQLEGTLVVSVHPERQAAKLGVEVGDRLVKIAGYPIPDFDLGDVEGEKRAEKEAKKMLKEMPPPVRLTFQMPTLEGGGAAPWAEKTLAPPELDPTLGQDIPQETVVDAREAVPGDRSVEEESGAKTETVDAKIVSQASASSLPAEASSRMQMLEEKLQREREKQQRHMVELREARQTRALMTASLEAEKRQVASLQSKLEEMTDEVATLKARNKELLDAATRAEGDNDAARDLFEQREQTLQDELSKLQKTLADEKVAGNASVEAAAEASKQQAAAAKEAAEQAQAQQAVLEARLAEMEEALSSQARQTEECHVRCDAAEARAAAVEQRNSALQQQLGGFDAAHDTELELFREEQERLKQKICSLEEHNKMLTEKEQTSSRQLLQVQQEHEELRAVSERHRASADAAAVELQAAAIEATAARKAAADAEARATQVAAAQGPAQRDDAASSDAGAGDEVAIVAELDASPAAASGETAKLYARIDLLQARCSTLQRKLIEQRTIGSNVDGAATGTGGGQRIPVFMPCIIRVAGPRAGQLAALFYGLMDGALRGFTQRLLKRDMWLWIFYAHLVVLYTIAASCLAQATPDPNAPMKAIEAHMHKAGAAQSPTSR